MRKKEETNEPDEIDPSFEDFYHEGTPLTPDQARKVLEDSAYVSIQGQSFVQVLNPNMFCIMVKYCTVRTRYVI